MSIKKLATIVSIVVLGATVTIVSVKNLAQIEKEKIAMNTQSEENSDLAPVMSAIDGLSEEKKEEYEADGTLPKRQAFAQKLESGNSAYYTSFAVEKKNTVQVSDIANIIPSTYGANMPTSGNANILVFMVDFPDIVHDESVTKETAEAAFFGEDSLKSFYHKSSYEKLTIDGDVQDWYTAQHDRAYYVTQGIGALYQEVLDAYDAAIDYSQYDADSNGYIDGIYLHFAGEDTGWGTSLWSYVSYFFEREYDNTYIGARACVLHHLDVDTIRHETGHLMGLPDYYSYTIIGPSGNHNWVAPNDRMASGKGDFNPVSKMLLGWITEVKLLTEQGDYQLNSFEDTGDVAIVYPFGQIEGDGFLVVAKQKNWKNDDVLRILRVNGKVSENNGSKYYVHSNMYGEVPFVEYIADLAGGDEVNPYVDTISTHYYHEETSTYAFSGITVKAKDSATFELIFEQAPSKIDAPDVQVTTSVNQITATIDYSVPFAVNNDKKAQLVDEQGTVIATMDTKVVFGNTGYYIDKASCVLKVASYMEWGFDGNNEITVGSDQDYLLKPGGKYTIVIPAGFFRTVMGDIEEMRIDITADATADQTQKYETITSFDRCSKYITLTDGRAAYAYVDTSDYSLHLVFVDERGTQKDSLLYADAGGNVSICQLSDETLLITATDKSKKVRNIFKYDLENDSIVKTVEHSWTTAVGLYPYAGGFYMTKGGGSGLETYVADNDLLEFKEVLPDVGTDGYTYSNYAKFVVGHRVLYIAPEEMTLPGSSTKFKTPRYKLILYNQDGTEHATTTMVHCWAEDVKFMSATVDDNNHIILLIYDRDTSSWKVLIFDSALNQLKEQKINFPVQKINDSGVLVSGGGSLQCLGDGYFFKYSYVRQYNPAGIVGMFTTETYQQGILLDGNFNEKSRFDVAYQATAAQLGTTGNKFIVGDEYGYYIVNADLKAQEKKVTLSSDKYTIDNENQTITKIPEGTTVKQLTEFLRCSLEEYQYRFEYTYAERSTPIQVDEQLSCMYRLIVEDKLSGIGTIYTFPELPKDKDAHCIVDSNGYLRGYVATEAKVVLPEFVKFVSVGQYKNDFSCVTDLTTSASLECFNGAAGLKNLEKVTLLEGCESIGNSTFYNCTKLKEVILPSTVTSIGQSAFYGCTALEKLVIPASVKIIREAAFYKIGNEKLEVVYEGTKEMWDQIDFRKYGDYSTTYYDWESDIGAYLSYTGSGALQTVVAPEFKFSGAALVLQHNLKIDYKVKKALFESYGYTQPYVQFIFNGEIYYVSNYSVSGDYYVFSFDNIAPNQMKDKIYATLYATNQGVLCSSETRQYSVSEYCYNMLEKYAADEYAEFRTLLVDLLNYGAASQVYTKYNAYSLVNASLTEEQKAWGTQETPVLETVMDKEYESVQDPTVTWGGAGLNLQDSVVIRFLIETDNIENLSMKITSQSGKEWVIDEKAFKKTTNGYYVYFDGLNAGQMSETIYATVYNGENAVSHTIRYSIESYAYSKQDSTDTNLVVLLEAMMKYGDSAYAYVH